MHVFLRVSLACLSAGLVAIMGASGCNGSSTDDASTSDARAPKVPSNHRMTAAACTGARPDTQPANTAASGCTKNEDCTAGKNGRCTAAPSGAPENVCSYDQCSSDADCGGGVCACDVGPSDVARVDVCVPKGDCLTDADCEGGKGYCSPSGAGLCGAQGFFCHTPNDACTDDSDCTAHEGTSCLYDKSAGHWACASHGCD